MRYNRSYGVLRSAHLEVPVTAETLLDQVRQQFGRVVYTHKTHEKDRERYTRLGTAFKWVNVVLGALTLGGIVSTLLDPGAAQLIATAGLGTLNVATMLVQLSFDPLKEASLHREAAKQLLVVRNAYESLIADLVGGDLSIDEARTRRDQLEGRTQEAYRYAPDTSRSAYQHAQKALKVAEDMTFASAEIDAFLPESLRSTSV